MQLLVCLVQVMPSMDPVWTSVKQNLVAGVRVPSGAIARCGNCGGALLVQWTGGDTSYYCRNKTMGSCEHGPGIRVHKVESFVVPRLVNRLRHLRAPRRARKPVGDISDLLTERDRLRASLARLAVLLSEEAIGPEEHRAAREKQQKRLSEVEGRIEQAARLEESDAYRETLEGMAADLSTLTENEWETIPIQDRRIIVSHVIRRVSIFPRSQPPRIRIVWL